MQKSKVKNGYCIFLPFFGIFNFYFLISHMFETIAPSKTETEEIIEDNQRYTLFSWSKQKGSNPIAVKYGEGVYLYDYNGKRYIDFSSGLMNVNI
jgi:taurine---2-oxoglutarate transaminase